MATSHRADLQRWLVTAGVAAFACWGGRLTGAWVLGFFAVSFALAVWTTRSSPSRPALGSRLGWIATAVVAAIVADRVLRYGYAVPFGAYLFDWVPWLRFGAEDGSHLLLQHDEGLLRFRVTNLVLGLQIVLPACCVVLLATRCRVWRVVWYRFVPACALLAWCHGALTMLAWSSGDRVLARATPAQVTFLEHPVTEATLLAFVLVLAWFCRARAPATRVDERTALPVSLAAAVALVYALGCWPIDGAPKPRTMLVDDAHSQTWAPAARALSFDWYGDFSTYNLSSMCEYLGYSWDVRVMTSGRITADRLTETSVLVLKMPKVPFDEAEQRAIRAFVERGGGLLLIGDHTDLLSTTSNLNDVASGFGIRFRNDYTRSAKTGGFSVAAASWTAVSPLSRVAPAVEFMTGCTLEIAPYVNAVVTAPNQEVVNHDWADNNHFGTFRSDPSQPHGTVVLCAATTFGAGRVAAISDSTMLSGFALFYGERAAWVGACASWLGYENAGWMPSLWLQAIALCAGVILLSRFVPRADSSGAVALGILVGHFGALARAELLSSTYTDTCDRPVVRVLTKDSLAWYPPVLGYSEPYDQHEYDTWFTAWLRGGYFPRHSFSLDDALAGDCVVMLNPTAELDAAESRRVGEWVEGGGKLVVAWRRDNFSPAAVSSWLAPTAPGVRLIDTQDRHQYRVSVAGMHVLDDGEISGVQAWATTRGKGKVVAALGAEHWNTKSLGHCFDVPDTAGQARFDSLRRIVDWWRADVGRIESPVRVERWPGPDPRER